MTARTGICSIVLVLLAPAACAQEPDSAPPDYTMHSAVYSHSEGDELIYEVFRPAEQNGAAVAQIMSGGVGQLGRQEIARPR